MKILAPVSFGELVDKITILEIKFERISDPNKLANVRTELTSLSEILGGLDVDADALAAVRAELKSVNESLWVIEDDIRARENASDFGPAFVKLARSVYKQNDKRFEIKSRLNALAGSAIVEEKSYTQLS